MSAVAAKLARARGLVEAVLGDGAIPARAPHGGRWSCGVLAPAAWSEAGGCEPWWLEAQLLVAGAGAVRGELRFLQRARGAADVGAACAVPLTGAVGVQTFAIAGGDRRAALAGRIVVRRTLVPAERPVVRVAIRVENTTPWHDVAAPREAAIAAAFASTHLVLAIDEDATGRGGMFLSALDPPAWAADAAVRCTSTRTFPVLVGASREHRSEVVLAAPFAMVDHVQLAPERPGDACDACELDGLLVLRAPAHHEEVT